MHTFHVGQEIEWNVDSANPFIREEIVNYTKVYGDRFIIIQIQQTGFNRVCWIYTNVHAVIMLSDWFRPVGTKYGFSLGELD